MTDEKLTTVAGRVEHARITAGLKSQPALARAINERFDLDVTPQTIQLIEAGETQHSRYLPHIASVTGFELDWLISGAGPDRLPQRAQPHLVYTNRQQGSSQENSDALRRAIILVDEVQRELRISITSEAKASIVEAVYRILSGSGNADATLVKNLFRLVKG